MQDAFPRTITDIVFAPGSGAYYYDDQLAIRRGAARDGFVYLGAPVTPGFRAVRQPAESLSIGLVLGDGFIAWGDMMTVQYAGAGGREPPFTVLEAQRFVETRLRSRLIGRPVEEFLATADELLPRQSPESAPISVEYGLSQALLRAAAHARKESLVEVLCKSFGLSVQARPIPIFSQSGDDRYTNVDKMILKRVDLLPHGLINSPEAFGANGAAFVEYVGWVARRVRALGGGDYQPCLHIDVYGMMSVAFGEDLPRIADCIALAEQAAAPLKLYIETPIDFGGTAAQIDGLSRLRSLMRERGSTVRIVADEWCNNLEDIERFAAAGAADIIQIKMPDVGRIQDSLRAVIACRRAGIGAYLGGSCAETELSAATSVHVGIASQADMMLAKPAMDVDAAITIVRNEQSRALADLNRRGYGISGRTAQVASRVA